MRFYHLFAMLTLAAVFKPAYAHEASARETSQARLHFAALERARVSIRAQGQLRIIESNGLANHATGQFPSRGNPHRISAQQYRYTVPLAPQFAPRITQMRGQPFGVAINGVPFDPGTAECYGQPRGARPGAQCDWREEAIVAGVGQLGLDSSNAHVQPSGAYHYHGVPNGLVAQLAGDLVLVGYAADGFPMLVSRLDAYRPSYRLKSGTRPSGPGGRYSGKYTQDFAFDRSVGNLDECNGVMLDNGYAYVLTKQFPFIPRCWKGTPDKSFARRGPAADGGSMRGSGRPRPPHPPHHLRHGI